MTPRDLMAGALVTALVGSPEMDPLTEKDALVCAPLVEAVFDAVNMRVGLLFDLRVAEQLRMANTGLIVLGGVEAFEWRAERRYDAEPHAYRRALAGLAARYGSGRSAKWW
jgi:hypothetical protein